MFMDIKTILCPTDLSAGASPALQLASMLANENGARLLIAHAVESAEIVGAGGISGAIPATAIISREDDLNRELTQVTASLPNIDCAHRLVRGPAADAIVRLAEEEHADLIVMDTHGRTGLRRLLMGSVAETVVRHANCPVVTIHAA